MRTILHNAVDSKNKNIHSERTRLNVGELLCRNELIGTPHSAATAGSGAHTHGRARTLLRDTPGVYVQNGTLECVSVPAVDTYSYYAGEPLNVNDFRLNLKAIHTIGLR